MSNNISVVVRAMFDNRLKSEMILEEVKRKDSKVVLLQHNKETGDMSYIMKHPKSPDHVIYSSSMEGQRSDVILHRNHIEEMLRLITKKKDDK
jgi:hypothetical protein